MTRTPRGLNLRGILVALLVSTGVADVTNAQRGQGARRGAAPAVAGGQLFGYEARRRPADELAKALLERYEGNPGVSVVVAPGSNLLRVSALAELVNEVRQTLSDLDRPPRPVAGGRRIVYDAKRRPADELAKALLQRYEGNPGVSAFVGPESNVLLVSALPGLVEEVARALSDLDQPPRTAMFEVLLVEFAPRKGANADSNAPNASSETKELSGPAEQVESRIKALTQTGSIVAVKRMCWQVREDETSVLQAGEDAPGITGAVPRRGSPNQVPLVQQNSLGTNVSAAAKFTRDGKVTLELSIRDNRLHTPSGAPAVGKDENGPIIVSPMAGSRFDGKKLVGPGQAVLLEELEYDSVLPGYRLGVIVKVDGKPSAPADGE